MIPSHTPGKHPFELPSDALKDAIAREWHGQKAYASAKMPLTALAYTALDRIAPQKEAVVEALLVYADTDTLCYRSENIELRDRQKDKWDIVLGWSSLMLGEKWQVGEGIMPHEQTARLHASLKAYLEKKDAFFLAAFSVLAGGFSSLVLAKAVAEKHLSAAEAFTCSRMEEDYSVEKWGRDEDAARRTERLRAEMLDAGRFLKLLDAP